jgi:hypothetical protein
LAGQSLRSDRIDEAGQSWQKNGDLYVASMAIDPLRTNLSYRLTQSKKLSFNLQIIDK